jgi:hypothetical protein
VSLADAPDYRTEVDRVLLKCRENKFPILKSEFYNASNNLVNVSAYDSSKEIAWAAFLEKSPYEVLQRIVCKPNEAQQ